MNNPAEKEVEINEQEVVAMERATFFCTRAAAYFQQNGRGKSLVHTSISEKSLTYLANGPLLEN